MLILLIIILKKKDPVECIFLLLFNLLTIYKEKKMQKKEGTQYDYLFDMCVKKYFF